MTQFSINSAVKITCFLLLAGFGQHSFAAMYKWVDEDGNTHYTQSPPPPGITGKEMKPPPKVDSDKAIESLDEREKMLNKMDKDRNKKKEEMEKAEKDKETDRRLCEQAKARLASYQRPRVTIADKDGTRRRAGEEERQAELAKSREQVNKYCK